MPRTSAITKLSLPGWGGLELGSRTARSPAHDRPSRIGGVGEVAAGVLLVVAWAMLWAIFLAGVVEPAAALRASAADHPSLDASMVLPDARPGAEPGPVDTTGRAP